MVTRNKGMPTPIKVDKEKLGRTNSSWANCKEASPQCICPEPAAVNIPASKVKGTAYRGTHRFASKYTSSIVPTITTLLASSANTLTPKRKSTPASIADASDLGMYFMSRSNQPKNPTINNKLDEKMNTPVASDIDTPLRDVANNAAPGVDQAVSTGLLKYNDKPMQVAPIPMPRAHSQEAMQRSGLFEFGYFNR